MLEFRETTVKHGKRTIVSKASFTAKPGEVTVIIGPNGSGKSTLLKAACGDLRYEGDILLHGKCIRSLSLALAAEMRAVMPQAATLNFPFSVREVIAMGARAGRSGFDPADMDSLPELALEKVGLSGFAGRTYQQLSGGEQQRVQLARVLAQVWMPVLSGQPRFLFLDEPVSNLDIAHQLTIMKLATDFARNGGGVLAIIHDLNLAAMSADKIVALKAGKLVAEGSPEDMMTGDILSEIYGLTVSVDATPKLGNRFVLPQCCSLL